MTQKIKLSVNSDCCSDECCSPDTSPKQELKKIKERYGKIAVSGNSESCCMPECCSSDSSPKQALLSVGYDNDESSPKTNFTQMISNEAEFYYYRNDRDIQFNDNGSLPLTTIP